MSTTSKRIQYLRKAVQNGALSLEEASQLICSIESKLPSTIRRCRFDQTVELSVRLGLDAKQADQMLRGALVLPHGIGKSKRVLVFCQGTNQDLATSAGADFVGGKELAEKIKSGWTDFDVAIATPDMMSVVGVLGRILGPRGLMPSPKAGTVTNDFAPVVREYKAGKIEFRMDDGANVHCAVGKVSFAPKQIEENSRYLLDYIVNNRPTGAKGQYIRSISLGATMTPSVLVSIN